MELNLLFFLTRIHVAGSIAIIVILFSRKFLFRIVGYNYVNFVWGIVPCAMLISIAPPCLVPLFYPSPDTSASIAGIILATEYPAYVIWGFGSITMLFYLIWHHIRFLKQAKIGKISTFGNLRVARSNPENFSDLFNYEDRKLIFAHERCHLRSGDLFANLIAGVLLALNWFNPLYHRALTVFRFDMEMACDQKVLSKHPNKRQLYGLLLLKSQIMSNSPSTVCYWTAKNEHQLFARLTNLKKPSPVIQNLLMCRIFMISFLLMTIYIAWFFAWGTRDILIPRAMFFTP